MSDNDGKPKSTDPEELARFLELELMQKRAEWQRAAARHRTIRMVSFAFLFLVILAGLFAYFFVFSELNENRSAPKSAPTTEKP